MNGFCRSSKEDEQAEDVEYLHCLCNASQILGLIVIRYLTDLSSTNIRCINKFVFQTGWRRGGSIKPVVSLGSFNGRCAISMPPVTVT